MSFNIQFDYRFDTAGFFDDPARRVALDAAAAEWEMIINDEFRNLPAGLQFEVTNPTTDAIEQITLTDEVDDIIVFVGARNLLGNALGRAGPTGYSAEGDIYRSRITDDFRGQGPVTDFEPWAGTIVFDLGGNWSFDLAGPVAGMNDFLSIAVHEIGHILGIGTSAAFDNQIVGETFDGPNARAANGGAPVPLHDDQAHVEDGHDDDMVSLDPSLTTGTRVLLSDIDKAILADIGFEVTGFVAQGSQPPIATNGAETIFGSILADTIDGLGGNDQIQGGRGNDLLLGGGGGDLIFGQEDNDTLFGGGGDDQIQGGDGEDELRGGSGNDLLFGQNGRDTFVVHQGDGNSDIIDFDLANEVVRLVDSGFNSLGEVLAAITPLFSNVSRLTLPDGTTVDIRHAVVSSTPLTAAHFELASAQAGNTPPTGAVTIDGSAIVGAVLTADVSAVMDADGLGSFSYLWLRNGMSTGQTGPSYQTGMADEGAVISVQINYVDQRGTAESLTSAGTAPLVYQGMVFAGDGGPNTVTGADGDDTLLGAGGDDTLVGGAGDDLIDGGPGTDRAQFSGDQTSYTLTLSPDGPRITDRRPDGDGSDLLEHVELLDFATEIPAFTAGHLDLRQFGGPATLSADELNAVIELYIAYFNRAPDAVGLFFWGTAFANGTSLDAMASLFIDQVETLAAYPPGTSNTEFAQTVYSNVLGRLPDLAGFNFWVGVLESGFVSRDAFILEVLRGAKADPPVGATPEFIQQQLADRAYLATKTDIGAYFAVHKGMSDTMEASAAMALFDGSASSVVAATDAIDGFFADALDPNDGDFLMPLVGVLDSPFLV